MMNKINYYIIGRFQNGSRYGIASKQAVEGYQIDDIASVRKQEGKQGTYWTVDSWQTGIGIVTVGSKTRKAAVDEYEKVKEKVVQLLTEERLEKLVKDLEAARTEEELGRYETVNYCTTYNHRLDKVLTAARKTDCIVKNADKITYLDGGNVNISGTAEMLEEVKEIIEHYKKHDEEGEKEMKQEEQIQEVKQEEKIDITAITPENLNEYLPALLMRLANDKHNTSIILAAGIEAGVIPATALLECFQFGRMPAVHTFDIWKKAGYSVRKGEHAAFRARIWKHVEKTTTLTAEDAAAMNAGSIIDGISYKEGDTIQAGKFIKKEAFFFTASQVEKTPEPAALPDLPDDVKKEVKGRCCWISGNTRPIKEDLKAAGFRWSKKNNAWYRAA